MATRGTGCDTMGMSVPPIVGSAARGVERLIDRVVCVLGAVTFSQFPEFMQQYLQRLEGHFDEARLGVERFQQAASQSGMTLEQLIVGAGQNPDPSVARLSGVVREAVRRADELGAADAALRHASAWTRPFVFLAHLDGSIARATWDIYRPAVPTTAEGLVYAAVGVLAALCLYHLGIRMPLERRFRRTSLGN